MSSDRLSGLCTITAGLISSPACSIYLKPDGAFGDGFKIDVPHLVEDAERIFAMLHKRDFMAEAVETRALAGGTD